MLKGFFDTRVNIIDSTWSYELTYHLIEGVVEVSISRSGLVGVVLELPEWGLFWW